MIRILLLSKVLLLQRKLGPMKGIRVRKIEVHTDTPTECELWDTVAEIQRMREEREAGEREEEVQKQKEEAMKDETTCSAEEGMVESHAKTDRSDTEIYTEACGEAGTSQSQDTRRGT